MTTVWKTPAEMPGLGENIIHVWLLEIDRALRPSVEGTLSKPELERAAAFRFPEHRDEFIVARGALRILLGKYVNSPAGSIEIRCAEKGKPYLSTTLGDNIQFNVSHSGKYAVFGFTSEDELGIDIELHQPELIDDSMVDQCLTGTEKKRYLLAPAECKVKFFFDTWARKEAYLKLDGDGLGISPNEFQLSAADSANDLIRGEQIHFTALPQVRGYSLALATRHQTGSVEFYRLGSNLPM